MKKLLIVLACVAATVMVSGQGTLDVRNKVTGTLDAPIFDVDGITKLAGAAYLAQVYAGPVGGALVAVGDAYPFRTGTGVGYYDYASTGTKVYVSTVAPGATAQIQVVAWEAAAGTYADAMASTSYKFGASTPFSVVLGDAGSPPSVPAFMVGLTSFSIAIVPEPSTMVLGLLGAAALLLRRRK